MKPIFFAPVALFSLFLVGCGGTKLPDGMPKPQPTTITVTQDGKGLDGASVTLMPIETNSRWTAGGVCNSSGVVKIMTLGQYAGAVPGKYKVIITKRYNTPSSAPSVDPEKDPAGYTKSMEIAAQEVLDSFDLVDPKFSKLGTTPETIDVVAGTNTKTIDVGKAVRVKIGK